MDVTMLSVLILLAYLLGSVPVAYYLTLWTVGVKLTDVGTGNVGIANTFRHAPRWVGYAAVAADAGKVLAALLPARHWLGLQRYELYILLAALALGNMFSVFLRFRGSKARTISSWGLLVLQPWVLAALAALWGVLFWKTKNSRLGMMVVLALCPVALLLSEGSWAVFAVSSAIVLVLVSQNGAERDDFKYAGMGR